MAIFDGYVFGSVENSYCTCFIVLVDGFEVVGIGSIVVGDYVVVGILVIKGTSFGIVVGSKVCKVINILVS